jgi:hypothetical protein
VSRRRGGAALSFATSEARENQHDVIVNGGRIVRSHKSAAVDRQPQQTADDASVAATPASARLLWRRTSRPPGSSLRSLRHALGCLAARGASGCIAGMMRKPNGARLTSDAALLLLSRV